MGFLDGCEGLVELDDILSVELEGERVSDKRKAKSSVQRTIVEIFLWGP